MATLTQSEIRKLKQELRNRLQDELSGKAIELQDSLYNIIVDKFIDEFTTSNGVITYNEENLRASDAIQKIFDEFNKTDLKKFLVQFVTDIGDITNLNVKYFESMSDDLSSFKDVSTKVTDLMYFRLGIKPNGQLIKNGFLYSFQNDTRLRNGVAQKVAEGVTKQLSKKDMLAYLKTSIVGDEPASGALVKQFNETLYNVYSQYDNAMSRTFAVELNLRAFIYAGGIIDTSREFCIEKNDQVFTTDEADNWVNDPLLPRTKKEKETGIVVGYDPMINFGRWEGHSDTCRHHANFISNAEAIRRRPDLAGIL